MNSPAVEISYSFTASTKDPHFEFTYHLIGTDGLIRYERQTNTFELRTPAGTTRHECYPEKNFQGMYEQFARFLLTGEAGALPSTQDGWVATKIARSATDQAIRDRLRR